MKRGFELLRFEDKPFYKEGEREDSYYMDGGAVLGYLAQRPDLADAFKKYIPPENFIRFNDPDFRSSQKCEDLKRRIDNLVEPNKKANEIWKDLMPLAINEIKQHLNELEVGVPDEKINKRAEGVAVVCLDLYRYWANIIRKKLRPDIDGFYMIEENLIGYRIPDSDKFNEISPEMQIENLKPVILHELIHALSYHNFWLAHTKEIKNGEKKINPMDFRGRRIGVSSARFGEPLKLNPLNEAITQRLTMDLLPKFLNVGSEAMQKFTEQADRIYKDERKILDSLLERIDWKIFMKAYFDRDGLLRLAKELKEKFGNLMPSELNELMKNNSFEYLPAEE